MTRSRRSCYKRGVGNPGQPQLVRVIGRWSLAALVVNSIIGSAIFGLPAVIAGLVGTQSPLVFLLAALPMAVVIGCFAEVSSQFSGAGGPYLYAHAAFGRFIAILVGWLAWLVRLTASAANANLLVTYLGQFWPAATARGARVAILALVIGVVALVNYRGVASGTRMSNLFTWAKLLPMAGLLAMGLLYIARHHPVVTQAAPTGGIGGWMQAVLLLVFAYGGFEGALMPLGEARNPRRDAPFALFAALLTCVVLYTLTQFVVIHTLADAAHADRPLAAAAQVFLGDAGAAFIAATALVALYGYLSAQMLNGPRLTFALAQHGEFPPIFAAIHPRFRSPHFSILVFALAMWGLAAAGTFTWNLTLSAVARLFTYGVVCASLIVLRRRQPERIVFRLPGGPLFAVLGVLFTLALVARMGRSEAEVLAVITAIAILTWLWARRHAPPLPDSESA